MQSKKVIGILIVLGIIFGISYGVYVYISDLNAEQEHLERIVTMIENKDYDNALALPDIKMREKNQNEFTNLKLYANALKAKKTNDILNYKNYLDSIPLKYQGCMSEEINKERKTLKIVLEEKALQEEKLAKEKAKIEREKARENADFTKPLSNYAYFDDYLTSKSYTLMYEEDGITYMYDTFGNGTSKRAIILNQYDLADLDRGDITTAELRSMSMEARNYKFGNILHLIYFDGGATFVMICNLNTYSITCYFKSSENKEYGEGSTFNLLDYRS